MVLLKVSLMNFILRISRGDQIEAESRFTRSIIDELHFSDIQVDQMVDERGVTRSTIEELHSSDIQ